MALQAAWPTESSTELMGRSFTATYQSAIKRNGVVTYTKVILLH